MYEYEYVYGPSLPARARERSRPRRMAPSRPLRYNDGMARRRSDPPAPAGFHHQPFRALKGRTAPAPPPSPPAAAPAPPAEPDEAELFAREMAGVRPLDPAVRQRVVPPPPSAEQRRISDPEAEALAELSELVAGNGVFDIADTVEFIEGAANGVDRGLVRRLRAGEFACQDHLDLHGMTSDEARTAVNAFLQRAWRDGLRCVLIIHGRGLNSKDHVPVLKARLTGWLTRGTWSRIVLAFTSARPCDGGAGAMYVLLRRRRSPTRPGIRVTHGAKW